MGSALGTGAPRAAAARPGPSANGGLSSSGSAGALEPEVVEVRLLRSIRSIAINGVVYTCILAYIRAPARTVWLEQRRHARAGSGRGKAVT